MAKVDFLLINPSLDYKIDEEKILSRRIVPAIGNQESPQLGMAYLYAVAKQNGFTAKFVDMIADKISLTKLLEIVRESQPLLLGFTAYTIQIKAAGFIAEQIKIAFPDIQICCGGPHVTAMPKEALKEFPALDFVVPGEAEEIIINILQNLKAGKPVTGLGGIVTRDSDKIPVNAIKDLNSLPLPSWESFDLKKYPGIYPHLRNLELPISTSRGCPYSCVFCSRNFGKKRRSRSIKSVIEEIEYDINSFNCDALTFIDETLTADIKWSKEFLETMIDRGLNKKIKWACETRVDTSTPDLFYLMKEAGCYSVSFGLESGDDAILKKAAKGFSISQTKKAVGWAKEAGLLCTASFIIGLPGETEETVWKSIKLAKELNILSTTFPIAVPLPGTELREMALKHEQGLRILTNNWDDYGKQYPGVMESDQLSIEKRRELQQKAYEYNPKKDIRDYLK
jgi:anaerobic magnesium-protoporphyrin IX monomethyl ester cyclase